MGNRVKGRTKRKSIKAAAHSGMGSKRKLSRMGKKRQKDRSGLDATLIGRAQCLKRLQVSLRDFRRLCILKGIYPREPRGRAPKNKKGQVYYHVKDLSALAHEPVLDKFREFRAFMKKVRRAAGRDEKDEAARKHAMAPTYTLHHLVQERYPRFVDALQDMDDALTLVYLFAALPSVGDIRSKVTTKAKLLAASWSAYCATTSSITKAFISVKGVYLEASIHGTDIRWIVPHAFTQSMPEEVDYKVMLTFFEFYETLLGFVLFRLYHELGVRYPLSTAEQSSNGSMPSVLANNLQILTKALSPDRTTDASKVVSDAMKETEGECVDGKPQKKKKKKLTKKNEELLQTVGTALQRLESDDEDDEDEGNDGVDVAGPLASALQRVQETTSFVLSDDAKKRQCLLQNYTIFLSREVPRGYLDVVALSFGAKVGWEHGPNSPIASPDDPSITHHVVDRPALTKNFGDSREYIQPQWILDCTNNMFVLPVERYRVGATLPPHLSPWVDDEEEGYKPEYAMEIERLKNGETVEDMDDQEMRAASSEGPNSEMEDASMDSSNDDEDASEEDDDEEGDCAEERKKSKSKDGNKKAEDEQHVLAKVMMSKKAARLYGRMQHGIAQKVAAVQKLEQRREDLKGKEKGEGGKTVSKQKVDRLKKERKRVENKYSDATMKKKRR